MGTFRYVVVDVFTDRALAGNQLAVFTDARDIPETQLQPLAREMNFSETGFVDVTGRLVSAKKQSATTRSSRGDV